MANNTLSLTKQVPILVPTDSIRRAVGLMRATSTSSLLVATYGQIVGLITQSEVTSYLASAGDYNTAINDPIEPLITGNIACVSHKASIDELLEAFSQSQWDILPVTDDFGSIRGAVARHDLLELVSANLRPPSVGGMATPLGVYLTTGSHSGGAGNLGLFLTGVSLVLMITAASLGVRGLARIIAIVSGLRVDLMLSSPATANAFNAYDIAYYVSTVLTSGLMLLLLRWSPLSGYHAAEHMTVNAIEAGEELSPEVVGRMPRVHPRCGTNMLAAASVFMIITQQLGTDVGFMIALVVVVLGWRKIGGMLQYFITTKNPDPQQLMSGIAAGNEVLEKYRQDPGLIETGWPRVWRMGFIQTAAGMAVTSILLYYILGIFHIASAI